jgi:hypothetical protein
MPNSPILIICLVAFGIYLFTAIITGIVMIYALRKIDDKNVRHVLTLAMLNVVEPLVAILIGYLTEFGFVFVEPMDAISNIQRRLPVLTTLPMVFYLPIMAVCLIIYFLPFIVLLLPALKLRYPRAELTRFNRNLLFISIARIAAPHLVSSVVMVLFEFRVDALSSAVLVGTLILWFGFLEIRKTFFELFRQFAASAV